jgi:Tfp pilus assembly protein PilX
MKFGFKQQGFILITVLIFLSLILLFTTQMLHTSLLALRTHSNAQEQNKYFQLAEQALTKIEQTLPARRGKSCFYAKPLANAHFKDKNLTQWQMLSCQDYINHQPFFYLIEKIVEAPCTKFLNNVTKLNQGIIYYRITVYITSQQQYPTLALQSTYAQIENGDFPPCAQFRLIPPGRQSWQELSLI